MVPNIDMKNENKAEKRQHETKNKDTHKTKS